MRSSLKTSNFLLPCARVRPEKNHPTSRAGFLITQTGRYFFILSNEKMQKFWQAFLEQKHPICCEKAIAFDSFIRFFQGKAMRSVFTMQGSEICVVVSRLHK